MSSFKNSVLSLLYKPFERLVDCAEYIYTLHSKKSHRILFFVVFIMSSLISICMLSGKLWFPSLHIGQNSLSASYTGEIYDPLQLLLDIRSQKGVMIVDVRSKDDYELGHIKGALSIPLQGKTYTYPSTKQMDKAVKIIKQKSNKKTVVIYGTFEGSTYVHEFVKKLRRKNVSAFSLAVGWNEWYHFRNLWLPESLWNTIDMDLYVQIDGSDNL